MINATAQLASAALFTLALSACTGGAGDESSTEASASVTADASSSSNSSAEGSATADASSSTEGSTGETSAETSTGGGSGLPVDLGSAGDFAVLAKSGISTVPASAITGDIGVSPAAATFITGFSLTADASNEFATSAQITGRAYASDYTPPTPAKMTAAIADMELAFTDAAGRAPDVTELGAGDIGGMTLDAGVYKWGTGLLIPTSATLSGSDTDVWVFQVAGDLTVSSAAQIVLADGAQSHNVFWQVAGFVDIGTTAHVEGVVLTSTSITLRTGASVNGRLMAQTAVELDANVVVEPAG